MKIIDVAMLYEYGIKERGYSYEYYNMYSSLKNIYKEVYLFDYFSLFQEKGKEVMNRELIAYIKKEKPDLVIFNLYRDEFISEVLDEIKKYAITLCYFWDDQWRINFTKFCAPHFSYITTPDFNGFRKWRERGYNNVIYSPFGCNHFLYKKKNLPKKYDISFVGGYHPYREWILKKLKKAGVNVFKVGAGWEKGFVSYEEIINIFNQSKINLNISNSHSWDLRYLLSSPRAIKAALSLLRGGEEPKNREQIKTRHFEICGCGGFQLSYYVEGIEHCYEIGKEIAIYLDIDDLIEKIKYYLRHDEERERIANAGYRRVLTEHTYEKRFREIINQIGL